jgi:hypothetical protein
VGDEGALARRRAAAEPARLKANQMVSVEADAGSAGSHRIAAMIGRMAGL